MIVREALGSPEPAIRSKAVGMVVMSEGPDREDILGFAMRDKDGGVRDAAAQAAAELGFISLLVEASKDDEPAVRVSSIKGLVQMGTPESYTALGRLVLDDGQGVRDAALDALVDSGESVPPGVWESVVMDGDSSENALLAGVKALSERPGPAYAKTLAYALEGHEGDIADAAAAGLIAIGPASLGYVHPMLGDSGLWRRALDIIVEISDPSSTPLVIGLMEDLDGKDRLDAISALGKLGGTESVDALLSEYATGDTGRKAAALKALANTETDGDDPRVLSVINDALGSGEETVRFYGVHAAAELMADGAGDKLRELAGTDPSKLVRRQAAAALNSLSSP
jgi:HEAT repeat protein